MEINRTTGSTYSIEWLAYTEYILRIYTGITEDLGSKLTITHADVPCAYPLGNVKVHMSQSDQLSLVSYPG